MMKGKVGIKVTGLKAFRRRLLELPAEIERAIELELGDKPRRARIRGRR